MPEEPYQAPKEVPERQRPGNAPKPQVIGAIFLLPLALLVAIAAIAGAFVAVRLIMGWLFFGI